MVCAGLLTLSRYAYSSASTTARLAGNGVSTSTWVPNRPCSGTVDTAGRRPVVSISRRCTAGVRSQATTRSYSARFAEFINSNG